MKCCPLSENDGAGPSAFSDEIRRARKEHACHECGRPIMPGSRYEYASGVWDGRPDSFKTCLLCVEIRTHFSCSGWIYGHLWSDLVENFFPDMTCGGPCMIGLSPEAKSFLIEQRMEWLLEHDEINDDAWADWPTHRDRQRPPRAPVPLYDDDDEPPRRRRGEETFPWV